MSRTRYIVPILGIVLLFGGLTTYAPAAHADCYDTGCTGDLLCKGPVGAGTCQTNTAATNGSATCTPACGAGYACQAGVCLSTASGSSNSSTAAASTPTNINQGASPSLLSDPLDYIMEMLMSLFAWLLGVAAITLDNSVYYTVVHMGSYVNNLSAVGVAWRILRDLGNIVLIFGFVALGIEVILDLNFYGGGTKMLPTLILAAVFLNFSLFAAEAVVDVGNLFATEFYTQINNGQAAAPQNYTGTNIANNGISLAVMNQLGLQTIYGAAISTTNTTAPASGAAGTLGLTNSIVSGTNSIFQSGHPFILGFMSILIFMIAAFVFFSLAFVLIARFVVLIFLIIVAPIGIAGLAVPKLDKVAGDWWGTLFAQTLTAPAMLLMLYVALAVITDANFLTGFGVNGTNSGASYAAESAWTGWLTSGGTAATTGISTTGVAGSLGALASVLLSFIVAMGLLLAVTMLAKRMGAIGGQWATNMGGKLTFGVAGFAARNTVGRTSNLVGRGVRKILPNEIGRYAAMPFDLAAKSSFDFRATGALKTTENYEQAKNAQKGGYIAEVDAKKKAQLAYGKTLDGGGDAAYLAAKDTHDTAVKARTEAARTQNKSTRDKNAAAEKQKKIDKELEDLEKRVDPDNYDQILEDKIEAKRKEKEAADKEVEAANISLDAAKTSKAAADVAFTSAKDTLDTTAKNSAQEKYAGNLKSGGLLGGTGFTTATTAVVGTGSAVATGAVIGSVLGPVGTLAGAAAGAGAAAAFRYLAPGTVKKSSASYQAGSDLDKKAKATPIEKMIDEISEATKDSAKEQKDHDKKEDAKDDAAAH